MRGAMRRAQDPRFPPVSLERAARVCRSRFPCSGRSKRSIRARPGAVIDRPPRPGRRAGHQRAACSCRRSRPSGAGRRSSSSVRPASRPVCPPTPGEHGARVFRFEAEVFGELDAAARRPSLDCRRACRARSIARGASRCEALQIFTKSAGQWRARVRCRPTKSPLPAPRGGDRHPAGRRAQQLSDQRRRRRCRRCASSRSPRCARSSIAPKRSASTALVMHPGSYTTGSEEEGLRLIARAASAALLRARRRAAPHDPPRAHRRAGHQPRPSLRAPRGDPRASRRIAAGRRLPRHLPPAGRRLRLCLRTAAIAETFEAFDRIVGIDRIKVVSPERLEEAMRQPRRPARAHRQGLPRARAVPAAAERSAVRRTCRCCSRRRSSIRPRAGARATPIRGTRGTCGR